MPPGRRTSEGVREPTELPRNLWPLAGAWLEDAFRRSGLSKRQVLSQIGYEGGTNRFNSYLAGQRLPTPRTLRFICKAIGSSYLEAVQQFGYYHELIRIIDDLVWLAEVWLEDDDASGSMNRPADTGRLESLRSMGVVCWRGEPITPGRRIPIPWHEGRLTLDPLEDPRFTLRYVIGWWHEREHLVDGYPSIEQLAAQPSISIGDAAEPSPARLMYFAPAQSIPIILPKPLALAIIIAMLSFPRRGDVFFDASIDYLRQIYRAIGALVQEAHDLRKHSDQLLRGETEDQILVRVLEALDDRTLPFNDRRVIAAEHAVRWADRVCQPFTHYARLGAFQEWGEVGSTVSTVTTYRSMPQNREASLPLIESLATFS